jgi:hypothetical protein
MSKPISPQDWDVRVRERNLRQGRLTEKDVEKFLSALPDREENAESMGLNQPALSGREDSSGQ